MTEATLTPPSTATPPAQGSPDTGAKVQEQAKPQTLTQRADAALADLRSQKQETAKAAPLPEGAPAETATETGEDTGKTEEVKAPEEEANAAPVLNEDLETITVGGKEVPLVDALENMTFEVFADGEYHPKDFNSLLDAASYGIHSAERNRQAKLAVMELDGILRQERDAIEKTAQQRVTAVLDDLLQKALNGVNGNGKPFANADAQKRAVELARTMKAELPGDQAQRPLTQADVEKLVQERTQKILEEQSRKQAESSNLNQVAQEARNALMEMSKGDIPFFTKPDGKLNTAVLTAFRKEVANVSNAEWTKAGSPKDSSVIKDIIAKTRSRLLPEFSISQPKAAEGAAKKAAPILKPSSGGGVAPATGMGEKPKHFANMGEAIAWKKRELGLATKKK